MEFPKFYELERHYKWFGCPCDDCAKQETCTLYQTTPVALLPQIKICSNYLKNGGVMTKIKMEKQETKKPDIRYIVEDYEVLPCINLGDVPVYLGQSKIEVGIYPKTNDDGVIICRETREVYPYEIYDTVQVAEKAVIDKKIEDLYRELKAEKEFTAKIAKIVSIGFFALAVLNLLSILIKFIAK